MDCFLVLHSSRRPQAKGYKNFSGIEQKPDERKSRQPPSLPPGKLPEMSPDQVHHPIGLLDIAGVVVVAKHIRR